MSVLSVNPSRFTMAVAEKLPLGFDVTPLLLTGEVPTSPFVTVTQLDSGASISGALLGLPSVAGNIITQTILGSALTPQKSYRVEVGFNVGATKVWAMELTLICSF